MSYKIYVKTDNGTKVCCSEFENFNEAKTHAEKMVVNLLDNTKESDWMGGWDNFVDELPDEIAELVRSYETNGSLTTDFSAEADTGDCRYLVDEKEFKIYESEDGSYAYDYAIQTNMLNMSDDGTNYYFRLWRSIGFSGDALMIYIKGESSCDTDDNDNYILVDEDFFSSVDDDDEDFDGED